MRGGGGRGGEETREVKVIMEKDQKISSSLRSSEVARNTMYL